MKISQGLQYFCVLKGLGIEHGNGAFVNYHIFRSFIKIGDFFFSFHIER